MKVLITYTDDWHNTKARIEDFRSLKDILDLQKREVDPLIIKDSTGIHNGKKYDFEIEVYNDYRE